MGCLIGWSLGGCHTGGNPEINTDRISATDLSAAPSPDEQSTYRLRYGDVLQIRFTYADLYDERVPIRPDGKITLRAVGEIQAAGLTPMELTRTLKEAYATTLRYPELAVIVSEFASRQVYVGGEVTFPGIIEAESSLTALQAIIQAGGFRDSAELRNVVVLRDEGAPTPGFMLLDLNDRVAVPGGGNDIVLASRDIVFVPKTRIAKLNQFVSEYITKLVPISKNFSVSYNFGNIGN